MKKTLTALVMAGTVALSACGYDVQNDKGERIRSIEKDDYIISVLDQESRRIGGTLPREVDIVAEVNNVVPDKVVGYVDNALAPNATFARGFIKYTSTDDKTCSWGPAAEGTICTAAEVKNAQQMLTKYSAFVSK